MLTTCYGFVVEKNYYLHQSARDAYRSYLLAYNSHAMKDIFNVHRLDLQVIILDLGSMQKFEQYVVYAKHFALVILKC